jgi:hypothetical protein
MVLQLQCYCCALHPKQYLYRSSCVDMMSMLDTEGAMDIEKLREWAEKSQLDPNDPRNASFFYFIKVRGYATEKLKCHKTQNISCPGKFISHWQKWTVPKPFWLHTTMFT